MKLFDGLKKLATTVSIVKDLIVEGNQIKTLFLTHNSDAKAIVVATEEEAEKLRKDGKEVEVIPPPNVADIYQIKAHGKIALKLSVNLLQAVVAKLGGK